MKQEKSKETPNRKKLEKIIKCRCSCEEYEALSYLAQKNQCTFSEIMRNEIFSKDSSRYSPLQKELLKQSFFNLILATQMPDSSKTMLIEEVKKL